MNRPKRAVEDARPYGFYSTCCMPVGAATCRPRADNIRPYGLYLRSVRDFEGGKSKPPPYVTHQGRCEMVGTGNKNEGISPLIAQSFFLVGQSKMPFSVMRRLTSSPDCKPIACRKSRGITIRPVPSMLR